MELHGGTISVESEVDQGTEFIVRIPIDRSYYEEEQIDNEAILPIQKTVTYEVTQVEAANEVEEVAEKANSDRKSVV